MRPMRYPLLESPASSNRPPMSTPLGASPFPILGMRYYERQPMLRPSPPEPSLRQRGASTQNRTRKPDGQAKPSNPDGKEEIKRERQVFNNPGKRRIAAKGKGPEADGGLDEARREAEGLHRRCRTTDCWTIFPSRFFSDRETPTKRTGVCVAFLCTKKTFQM